MVHSKDFYSLCLFIAKFQIPVVEGGKRERTVSYSLLGGLPMEVLLATKGAER